MASSGPILRAILALLITVALCLPGTLADDKTKRQIFREEVQPHSGGKIPESAFRSDRLALNKLQKVGVAVPDGASLDTRAHNVVRVGGADPESERAVVRIFQKDEGRYVPPEGQSHPDYPNTVQSTYRIRPPIGAQRLGPYIYHSVQGPPLTLGGASVAAVHETGTNYVPQHQPPKQQYAKPKQLVETPSYASTHAQYGGSYLSSDDHLQHIKPGYVTFPGFSTGQEQFSGYTAGLTHAHYVNPVSYQTVLDQSYNVPSDIPQPTPNPEHAQFIELGDLDSSLHFARDYPDLYTGLLHNYASTGLLQMSDHLRYSPYSLLASFGQDDLTYRLRRRTGDLEASPATHVGAGGQQKFSCRGRQTGSVYSDPASNCKRQFLCLPDGRAAAFVCPEGSRFDHRSSTCELHRRRIKLDQECNPV